MTTSPIQIDPKVIKAQIKGKAAATPKAAFGDVLADITAGVSAMGPASAELVGQWTGGSDMAGAVLNAAFSGVNVTGGYASASGYGGYGPYTSSPGLMGSPGFTTQTGFVGGARAATAQPYGGDVTNVASVDDPTQYQQEIMQSMNTNNLKLLELQALMQSNMQSWTTKSNILSAHHRMQMTMIEKLHART